ncbi:MAG: type II secretion system F family protein [Candidatus Aenigmarchaeota archaeon]|nr:type II secretion system F family protein [Candidatus Aenigmarchaeota archaeon]
MDSPKKKNRLWVKKIPYIGENKLYRRMIAGLSRLGLKYFPEKFKSLKEELIQSRLGIVFENYVGRMIFFSAISFVAIFLYLSIGLLLIGLPVWFSLIGGLISGLIAAFVIFTVFYTYPFQMMASNRNSIEANMPFAINHMSAIAASGVPPHVMFRLLTDVREYGEVAKEARLVSRNVEVFGMDVTSAIKDVAKRTPSLEFRQFLNGVAATISTGGDLKKYLKNAAEESLADYKTKREKYMSTLSTYADFYTAVLIAAPLFFISILSVMSMIGGELLGMSIPAAMNLGIYILIPILNVGFLLFIHFTQPTV